MRIINIKTLKTALIVFLLLLPALALAQTNASDAETAKAFGEEIGNIVDGNFNTNSTAMTIFSDLFGTWVKEDGGTQTILMLIISGIAALSAFAGIMMLSYMLVIGAATSAMSGEAMIGDKKVATWYIARVAVAYTLILPINGGISPFHTIFGQTLIPASSAIGDAGAEVVRQHMLKGGTFSAVEMNGGYDIQEKILSALLCTYDIRKRGIGIFGSGDSSPYMKADYATSFEKTTEIFGGDENVILQKQDPRSGITIPLRGTGDAAKKPVVQSIDFAGGSCGHWSFSYSALSAFQDDEGDIRKQVRRSMEVAGAEAAYGHVKETLRAMAPFAYALSFQRSDTNHSLKAPGNVGALLEENAGSDNRENLDHYLNKFTEVTADFDSKLYRKIMDGISNDATSKRLFEKLIKARDWVSIGYSFHDLRIKENVATDIYLKTIESLSPKDVAHNCNIISWATSTDGCGSNYEPQSVRANQVVAGSIQLQISNGAVDKTAREHMSRYSCGQFSCEGKTDTVGIENGLARNLANILSSYRSNSELVTDSGSLSQTGRGNLTIEGISSSMGSTLLTAQYVLSGASMTLVTLSGTATLSKWLKWASPVFAELADRLSGIVQLLLAQTFFLKYWIPMMPVITWMVMATGFFILAIEVMIAAPLALLLMLMPEGEGISGTRLERFIGLIVGLLMRPILLVAGFVAYLVFNSIATEYLLIPLWDVLSGFGTSLLGVVAIVMIFISALWQMQNLLLSLISSLPGYVAELVTSFRRDYGETSAIGRIGSAGEGYRERTGNSMGGGMMSAAENAQKKKQNDEITAALKEK